MQNKLQIGIVVISVVSVLATAAPAAAQQQRQRQRQQPDAQQQRQQADTMYRVQMMPTFERGSNEWASTQEAFFPPDYAYPRYALPPGEEKYAKLDAHRIKQDIIAITGISRRMRDDGNQYWGRITGSKYDHETTAWVAEQLRKAGVQQVRLQEFPMATQWWANSWNVTVTGGGKTVQLKTAYPWWGSDSNAGVDLEPVWVGLGTASDFKGRDVRGKAVLIYSLPSPGGLNNSSSWSGAVERANKAGAAAVFSILGFPGNVTNHPTGQTPPPYKGLTFSLGMADGKVIRDMIESDAAPKVHIQLAVEARDNLTTNSVWGVLPGMTDENILIMAHTETFFEGAADNASGVATMIELARFYASLPKEQRRRTITFLTTSCHHAPCPNGGIQWVRKNMDSFFAKTALIANCEHTAMTQAYFIGPNLVGSNVVAAHRWYMQGSDELKKIVTASFREFGVGTYSRPASGSGGELGSLKDKAPGFHVLADIWYHTDLDKPATVPEAGVEATVRAYAKIIDEANKLDLKTLRGSEYPIALK